MSIPYPTHSELVSEYSYGRSRTFSLPSFGPILHLPRRPSQLAFSIPRQNSSVFDSPSYGSESSLNDITTGYCIPPKLAFQVYCDADSRIPDNSESEPCEEIPLQSPVSPIPTSLQQSSIFLESIQDAEIVCSLVPTTSYCIRSFASEKLEIKALKEKQAAVKVEEKKPTPVVLKPIYSQKPSDKFKEILITCNYAAEPRERKRKMLCKLPHFILYDTADLEHSQVIRMIFAVARIPYELKKVEPAEIIDLPLRTVPALEIDGAKIGNITTICRHLGWRYDLSGQTAVEDSMVDMIAETIHEARGKLRPWLDHIEYRNVDYSKPECSDRYAFEYLETQLAPVIENLLHKNTSPWLIGQKLTWSDLMTAAFFNSIIYHRPAFFDRYPNIYLHNKKIAELPELEGMLYCVRDRTVEVSLFSHMTKPPMETQMTACT